MVDGPRFDVLSSDEKAELYRSFHKQLKFETKSKDRSKKKKRKNKDDRHRRDSGKGSKRGTTEEIKETEVAEDGETPDSDKSEKESDKVEDISVRVMPYVFMNFL